jgi:hypothetical protein
MLPTVPDWKSKKITLAGYPTSEPMHLFYRDALDCVEYIHNKKSHLLDPGCPQLLVPMRLIPQDPDGVTQGFHLKINQRPPLGHSLVPRGQRHDIWPGLQWDSHWWAPMLPFPVMIIRRNTPHLPQQILRQHCSDHPQHHHFQI